MSYVFVLMMNIGVLCQLSGHGFRRGWVGVVVVDFFLVFEGFLAAFYIQED